MHCRIRKVSRVVYELEFDRQVPLLLLPRRTPWERRQRWIFDPRLRRQLARQMARLNRAESPFEMSSPFEVYLEFYRELHHVEGLADVVEADRYSVTLRIASLFAPETIAAQVTECLSRHFFDGEPILVSPDIMEDTPIELP
jgi:hypothetical protein